MGGAQPARCHTAFNIRRLLSILEAIDVELYKEELAVIHIKHADAGTLRRQLSEIFAADSSGTGASSSSRAARRARSRRRRRTTQAVRSAGLREQVRITTDDRTNSLLVLASRSKLHDIRELIRKLDVPVTGHGRIHVYYLKRDCWHIAGTGVTTTLDRGSWSKLPLSSLLSARGGTFRTPSLDAEKSNSRTQ